MAKQKLTRKEKFKQKSVSESVNETSPSNVSSSNNVLKHSLFLFVLALVTYCNTLFNGFALDDTLVILGNSFTTQGLDGLADIWSNDMFVGAHGREFDLEGGRYRPLSLTVFAVLYHFFGENAFVGHLTNILFYALTGVVFYRALRVMLPKFNEWIPLIASSIFIAHPIHTEVIANIKSLDEILSLLFLLLSFFFLFRKQASISWQALLCYFLSLLSKEVSITALAIIPLTAVLFYSEKIGAALKKTAPFLVVAIVYLALRESFSGGFSGGLAATNLMDSPLLAANGVEKIATLLFIAGKYLSLLVFPYPLSFDYSFDAIGYKTFGNAMVWASVIALAGIAFYAIKQLIPYLKASETQKPSATTVIVFGVVFYAAGYSVVSNIVFNIGTYMGERFVYMASAGFCIALAALICKLLKVDIEGEFKLKTNWLLPLIILLPLGVFASFNRNKAWKDNYTLYQTDIKTVPNSARAQLFLGIEELNHFYENKQPELLESSIKHITLATEIYPDFYHAFYNLGLAYQGKQDHKKALECFNAVLKIQPLHINTHYYMGMSFGHGFNDTKRAIEYMEKGIKYGYAGPDRYVNLGVAYGMAGNLNKALELFNKASQENPTNASIYQNIAITYQQLGQPKKAKEAYNQAYRLDPSLKKTAN